MKNNLIPDKKRAKRNQTLFLTCEDKKRLISKLNSSNALDLKNLDNENIFLGDFSEKINLIPEKSVDLLFLDPPYNLSKKFNSNNFNKMSVEKYTKWLDSVLEVLIPVLKPTSTIYICGDWLTSCSIFEVANKRFIIQNRITWEREKGRGSKTNWKNSSEDIWFCTISKDYFFDVESVKLRRKVLAPYKKQDGTPKDWNETTEGNFRDTHPSNLWTDISIPFWSMPENTDHPTQKSEKLLAKLILASTQKGDIVLDPFLGSGTTAVVAKKLGRRFIGIEIDEEYALLSLKRLEKADKEKFIQGYSDGIFWERNSGK